MFIKRSGKTIFGAEFTPAEQKAINMEIQRQYAEYVRKHKKELVALFLWQLRVQLGFGRYRLRNFYNNVDRAMDDMIKRYELDDSDDVWLCTHQLEEYGVNLDEWDKD